MPFFEYRCNECEHLFTLLQSRQAAREGFTCPNCESTRTVRVLSTFASAVKSPAAPACPSAMAGTCPNAGSCGHAN
ncbi:MAG TPA: zinc ribbon domain-containing protein [Armatimonadetes bacterium]|nr:zinc ribbon domain-containing protein [Armatimonadota bacterium]